MGSLNSNRFKIVSGAFAMALVGSIGFSPAANAIDSMPDRHERCEQKDCGVGEQIWNEEVQDVWQGMKCGGVMMTTPWDLDEKCFEQL